MARVPSQNSKPEIAVRQALHSAGFRYRLHCSKLPGKPDIVMRRHQIVIFVNGCFWHGHRCSKFRWPKSNVLYWETKINGNVSRDEINWSTLRNAGWKVRLIWGCDVKNGVADLLSELQAVK